SSDLRNGLRDPSQNEAGGLSGQPVRQRSTEVIARIAQQTNGRLPIIGVGGVQTAVHVQEKLDAGASLVQLYTGLIYEGPRMVGNILRHL
ncbi:MAG: dihydroorotate dehydrogenase (quinone), partial [Chloroflexota bacterium]